MLLLRVVFGALPVLLLLLFLLFLLFLLLLFAQFVFGHLKVHLGFGVAGVESQTVLIAFHGFVVLALLELRVAEVVQGAGPERFVGGGLSGFFIIFGSFGIFPLPVPGVAEVVQYLGIAFFFRFRFLVGVFSGLVLFFIKMSIALAQQLVGRLGGCGGGQQGKQQ